MFKKILDHIFWKAPVIEKSKMKEIQKYYLPFNKEENKDTHLMTYGEIELYLCNIIWDEHFGILCLIAIPFVTYYLMANEITRHVINNFF